MERLFFPVEEERVVSDMVVQSRAEKQVGVEGQQQPFVRQCVFGVHPEHFAGCQEYHGGVREVIVSPSAAIAVVRAVFNQQDGIELELHEIFLEVRILQIDEACLRVQCLASETPVAFAYIFDVQYVFSRFHRKEIRPDSRPFSGYKSTGIFWYNCYQNYRFM